MPTPFEVTMPPLHKSRKVAIAVKTVQRCNILCPKVYAIGFFTCPFSQITTRESTESIHFAMILSSIGEMRAVHAKKQASNVKNVTNFIAFLIRGAFAGNDYGRLDLTPFNSSSHEQRKASRIPARLFREGDFSPYSIL